MGYTSAMPQLMTIPIYCFGAISAFGTAWFSDRFKRRAPFILVPQLVVVLAYAILFPLAPNIANRIAPCYVALCIACLGFYPINPGGQTWTANNLAGPAKRGIGLAFLTSLGNIGGKRQLGLTLLHPELMDIVQVSSDRTSSSNQRLLPIRRGMAPRSRAFAGIGAVAVVGLELAFMRINKKRDQMSREEVLAKYTEEELALMGDHSPLFRYTL